MPGLNGAGVWSYVAEDSIVGVMFTGANKVAANKVCTTATHVAE